MANLTDVAGHEETYVWQSAGGVQNEIHGLVVVKRQITATTKAPALAVTSVPGDFTGTSGKIVASAPYVARRASKCVLVTIVVAARRQSQRWSP